MRKRKRPNPPGLDEKTILSLFAASERPYRISAILRKLHLDAGFQKRLEDCLAQLATRGQLTRLAGGYWTLASTPDSIIGVFQALQSGGGKVKVTDPTDYPHKEIFISPFQTGRAWHNDVVRVGILTASGGGKGKVLEILERQTKEVPAILEGKRCRVLQFRPADARMPHKFLVEPGEDTSFLRRGEIAVLYPERLLDGNTKKNETWAARIKSILGPASKITTQEDIVKIGNLVPCHFPDLALAQASALPAAPTPEEISTREDLRATPFVTIDGADARDFDDAIHVEKTQTGWRLRVAIADVSHYVRPDETPDSLDATALARGNSWYFPRSVEPMLPFALSNGLCSLKPDEDRLAMLAEMEFSAAGERLGTRFAPIAMRSAARLVYGDVAAFFKGDAKAQVPDSVRPMLMEAKALYEALAARRRQQGALDFCLPEPAYEFDAEGKLIHMGVAERNDAHMLIEQFMIAANEAVAEFLLQKRIPALFRDHAEPAREKLRQLYITLIHTAREIMPPQLQKDGQPDASAIQKILASASGSSKEYIVNKLCLRAMAQARYQPDNIGHFGLASKAYCHFTSPIRRYADLLVHRSLKAVLGLMDGQPPDAETLDGISDQLNSLERRAVDCEREMAKRMACLALEGREGEELSGTISGVTDFGIFVEFDSLPAEGLIRMADLGNDWYHVDSNTQSLLGVRLGGRWQLGQPIRTRLKSIELDRQEIRLELLEPPKGSGRRNPKEGRPNKRRRAVTPAGERLQADKSRRRSRRAR